MMDLDQIVDWYQQRAVQYPMGVLMQVQEVIGADPDGLLGPQTVDRIRAWQMAHGLAADGLAGPNTLRAMLGRDIRAVPERPKGASAIRATFGMPGEQIVRTLARVRSDGQQSWIQCHRLIEPAIVEAFEAIHRDGLSDRIKSFDGCYVLRTKRANSKAWSTHAWGIAFDVNAADNPMTSKKNMKISDGQRELAPYFEAVGFHWGASFGDPMHFQFCTGY